MKKKVVPSFFIFDFLLFRRVFIFYCFVLPVNESFQKDAKGNEEHEDCKSVAHCHLVHCAYVFG